MQYAFVDESEPHGTGHGGPYVMVASLPLTEDLDALRRELQAIRPQNQAKLHWYESVGPLRQQAIDLICRLPVMHWAVIVHPPSDDSPERRRRSCMEMLFWEMTGLEAVEQIIMESRGPADDKRDMEMVGGLRSKKAMSGSLRVDHRRGPDEPLLWIPDVICGAINSDLRGDATWRNQLKRQLWICP